jgi:septum site-determining protein MinC
VLAPEPPVADWFAEFDALVKRSPGFFAGRPIFVDVSALPVPLPKDDLKALIGELRARNVRVMGVEGADASYLGAEDYDLPPIVSGGKSSGVIEPPAADSRETPAAAVIATTPTAGKPASLLIEHPVRSGQSVTFPEGDVTIVGSVASGAEVIAGGSIHIYGALRGRAIAGTTGNAKARIFCRSMEAELLAIDGLYKTADDIDAQLRRRPVQVWLEGDAMIAAALD